MHENGLFHKRNQKINKNLVILKTGIAEADSYEHNSIRISKGICSETFTGPGRPCRLAPSLTSLTSFLRSDFYARY